VYEAELHGNGRFQMAVDVFTEKGVQSYEHLFEVMEPSLEK